MASGSTLLTIPVQRPAIARSAAAAMQRSGVPAEARARGQALSATPDRRCGRASTCHSSDATCSSVAVSDSAIASCPRYSRRPPSMRVMAEARIGSPQLIVEAATARRLRASRLRSARRRTSAASYRLRRGSSGAATAPIRLRLT